jgi:hypothetical protein
MIVAMEVCVGGCAASVFACAVNSGMTGEGFINLFLFVIFILNFLICVMYLRWI